MAPSNTSHIVQHNQPTLVDLFSGAGGTGLGFQKAGFRILGAVEINPNAAETYKRNLKVKVKRIDIRQLSSRTFREELSLERGDLDVIVGCPPCQGFSRMRNQKGREDKRNDLVLSYLEYVEEFMPRFAVFENVPGLIRTEHGHQFYEQLLEGLTRLGYRSIEQEEEDAANYGVAQHRTRVVVIAGRDKDPLRFPKHTHEKLGTPAFSTGMYQPWLTVWDVIGNGNYPSLKAGENGEQGGKYPNHVAPSISEKVLDFIRRVPRDGGSRKDVSKQFWLQCHLSHHGHADVYGRLAWNNLANTITAGCTNLSKGRFVHPEQDRALTPREAAALQGFPDTFVFYGNYFASQIGNAVPPPLAYAIAELLRELLCRERARRSTHTSPLEDIPCTLDVLGDRLGA
jgi:DNA (cytosine-5)-methyltransferase 1